MTETGKDRIPILAIIGWSGSGKTTFITALIEELCRDNFRVAAIKHNAHKFTIDKPGKDSWQLRRAGAESVFITSADKMALIQEVASLPRVEEMADFLDDSYDLLLVEGYKSGSVPQIEIFRPSAYEEPVKKKEEVLERVINKGSKEELKKKARQLCKKIKKGLLN